MSDVLGFPHDHETVAWSHFLAQHEYKSYTAAFVQAFYAPFNELDSAQNELYTLRWLETANGVQLDGIGSIVGKGREVPLSVYLPFFGFITQPSGRAFGVARMRFDSDPYAESAYLGDEEYRYAITTKIAVNNSHGTAEDIMYVVNRTLNVTGTIVHDAGNANIGVYIDNMLINANSYEASILDAVIPRAGGVGFQSYVFDRDNTFGFSNQLIYFGFGVGILARQIASNNPPILIVDTPTLNLDFMTPGVLDPMVVFTRASAGTYIDSAGLIQGAVNNLVTNSQVFNSWPVKTDTTVTDNNTISPDGTTTGALITEGVAGTASLRSNTPTITAGSTVTVSVYLKYNGTPWVHLMPLDTTLAIGGHIWLNLQTGTLGAVSSQGGATNPTASIVVLPNGWYRLITTVTMPVGVTTVNMTIITATANGQSTRVANGTYYIWGAQIEVGAAATFYTRTTTAASGAPRWDYDPITHALRGLLLESASTNIVVNSNNVSLWPKTDTTVTANAATSPSGSMTATLITEGIANTAYTVTNATAVAANTLFSFSVYLKRGNCDFVRFVAGDSGSAHGVNVYINLVTGVTTFSARGSGTNVSASSIAMPNGWFRVYGTFQTPATTAQFYFMSAVSDVSAVRVNNAQYYAWGGQIEQYGDTTSLIVTGAAAATRAVDTCYIPTSPWYNPETVSLLFEMFLKNPPPGTPGGFGDGVNFPTTLYFAGSVGNLSTAFIRGGMSTAYSGPFIANTVNKICGTLNAATIRLCTNAGVIGSGSNAAGGLASAATYLTFGISPWFVAATATLNGHMRNVKYWPHVLPDAEIRSITTL